MASLGGYDLGAVKSERITKSGPIINLPAVVGDTKDNKMVMLLGVSRRISIDGIIKFSTQSTMNAWLRGISAMVKPVIVNAVVYSSDYFTEPYQGVSTFYVFVENFTYMKSAGEEQYVVNYSIDMVEGSGAADT